MQPFNIRPYTPADKLTLLQILRLNVPLYFHESEIDDFDKYLATQIEQYFVCELNGDIIGCGGVNFDNDSCLAKMSWDIMHPDFQGFGYGTQLLQYRLKLILCIEKIKTIMVRTSQHAHPFYEKNGFTLITVKPDYWAKGIDLYQMVYAG